MSVNNTEQLQRSLEQAISMQLQEIPHGTDPHSNEALARQVWQQEMTAVAKLPAPIRTARQPPATASAPAMSASRSSRTQPAPARTTKRPRGRPQHVDQDCSSCLDHTPGRDLVMLECCQSAFCKSCFRTWFETALEGKALPSCCGSDIAIESYGTSLTVTTKKKYVRVKEELDAEYKIYCGSTKCGKFIKIDKDGPPFVPCRYCKCKTCTTCKELISAHGRRKTCPNYLNDDELQQILSQNEWKRCPSCFAPVEKIDGCNNVKCTCGSRFCFRCGNRKRTEGDRCQCDRDAVAHYNARVAEAFNPAESLVARSAAVAAVVRDSLATPFAAVQQATQFTFVPVRRPYEALTEGRVTNQAVARQQETSWTDAWLSFLSWWRA